MLDEYIPFIILLTALYTVAGGICVRGNLHGTPRLNTAILALGTLLASMMGTTGAAMLLIRPLLRANDNRQHVVHVVVFFIFLVANVGGSLSPLGDPPLFLGFLEGVSFFWTTTHLALPMLFVSGVLLTGFYALDSYYFHRREEERSRFLDPTPDGSPFGDRRQDQFSVARRRDRARADERFVAAADLVRRVRHTRGVAERGARCRAGSASRCCRSH